jgi:hypothetical protein
VKLLLFISLLTNICFANWPDNIYRIKNTLEVSFIDQENKYIDIFRERSRYGAGKNYITLETSKDDWVTISINRTKTRNKLIENIHFMKVNKLEGTIVITKTGNAPLETPNENLQRFSFIGNQYNILDEKLDKLEIFLSWTNTNIEIHYGENQINSNISFGESKLSASFIEENNEKLSKIQAFWTCADCPLGVLLAESRKLENDFWQNFYFAPEQNIRIPETAYLSYQNDFFFDIIKDNFNESFEHLNIGLGFVEEKGHHGGNHSK